MQEDEFHSLILDIYDTALAPESWDEVLLRIAHALGARGAIMFEVLEGRHEEDLIAPYFSANYDAENVAAYIRNFGEFELNNQRELAKIAAEQTQIELINEDEIPECNRTPGQRAAHEALARHYISYRSGTILNKDCWNLDRFSVQYSDKQGPASLEEKAIARQLMPHLAKALRIGRPLISAKENWQAKLETRLDRLPYGVAIVTKEGELVLSNQEFQRILDQGKVFRLNMKKQLQMRQQSASDCFSSLLKSFDVHGAAFASPRNQSIYIPDEMGWDEFGILLEVSPAAQHPALERFPLGSRLLTVFDWSRQRQIDLSTMSRFFKLSNTELETLSEVVDGRSNGEIAEARSRSVETIKSQIKSLYKKTNTRNRTELAHLALAIDSPFSKEWLNMTVA